MDFKKSGVCVVLGWMSLGTQSCQPQKRSELAGVNATTVNPCIDRAIEALEIKGDLPVDPNLLNDILKNDMYIDDFSELQKLRVNRLNPRNISLRRMVDRIRFSLDKKHPATVEFLCAALSKNLIPKLDNDGRALVQRTLHHTYILNELTAEMSRDPVFNQKIIDHVRAKRAKFGIRTFPIQQGQDVHRISGEWFLPAKAVTMDIGIDMINAGRMGPKAYPVGVELNNDPTGLILNILEAAITDTRKGFEDNGLAGVALAINPPKKFVVTPDSHFTRYKMPQEWASLYSTWNLAFVTANVNHLNLVYPKLIIPEVLDAAPGDYLIARGESLWLTIQWLLMAMAKTEEARIVNGQPQMVPIHGINRELPNKEALARVWGAINLKYAKEYVRNTNHKELTEFQDVVRIPASTAVETVVESFKKRISQFLSH